MLIQKQIKEYETQKSDSNIKSNIEKKERMTKNNNKRYITI